MDNERCVGDVLAELADVKTERDLIEHNLGVLQDELEAARKDVESWRLLADCAIAEADRLRGTLRQCRQVLKLLASRDKAADTALETLSWPPDTTGARP